jgi:hypothetical protein
LLGALVAPATGFTFGLLDRVHLQEAVDVPPVAPSPTKIIQLDLASGEVKHDGIGPIGQLHSEPFHFAAKEPCSSLNWLWQAQALARGPNGRGVLHFGLNLDDMGHGFSLLFGMTDTALIG